MDKMSGRPVLITGATGLLGRECLKAFIEAQVSVVGTCFTRTKHGCLKIDLTNKEEVKFSAPAPSAPAPSCSTA
jgi:S-adenosylmethionine synthetase